MTCTCLTAIGIHSELPIRTLSETFHPRTPPTRGVRITEAYLTLGVLINLVSIKTCHVTVELWTVSSTLTALAKSTTSSSVIFVSIGTLKSTVQKGAGGAIANVTSIGILGIDKPYRTRTWTRWWVTLASTLASRTTSTCS